MNLMFADRELTDLEILRGKVLSHETELYLRFLYTQITVNQAEVDLRATDEERRHQELCRIHDGGKRAFIAELLTDSESAKAEIKLFDSNANQTARS